MHELATPVRHDLPVGQAPPASHSVAQKYPELAPRWRHTHLSGWRHVD